MFYEINEAAYLHFRFYLDRLECIQIRIIVVKKNHINSNKECKIKKNHINSNKKCKRKTLSSHPLHDEFSFFRLNIDGKKCID